MIRHLFDLHIPLGSVPNTNSLTIKELRKQEKLGHRSKHELQRMKSTSTRRRSEKRTTHHYEDFKFTIKYLTFLHLFTILRTKQKQKLTETSECTLNKQSGFPE